MGDKTTIEWTDASWNCIRGCSRISDGCKNCYAESIAARFSGPGQAYEGLAKMFPILYDDKNGRILKSVPRWTGDVRWIHKHFYDPMHWKRPRKIFVNSMSDLFHEGVPDEWIDSIFAVMALCPRHTFQCLTKRPGRMRDYMNQANLGLRVIGKAWEILGHSPWNKYEHNNILSRPWPLRNVLMGVSVEDQQTADTRIPYLLQTPAAIRWVSYEPALGPIDFDRHLIIGPEGGIDWAYKTHDMLNWIVCGGESGPKARYMDPEWARTVAKQCAYFNVPFFMKQLGGWPDKKDDIEQFPENLRIREYPKA